jgi:hypothetical protein
VRDIANIPGRTDVVSEVRRVGGVIKDLRSGDERIFHTEE